VGRVNRYSLYVIHKDGMLGGLGDSLSRFLLGVPDASESGSNPSERRRAGESDKIQLEFLEFMPVNPEGKR